MHGLVRKKPVDQCTSSVTAQDGHIGAREAVPQRGLCLSELFIKMDICGTRGERSLGENIVVPQVQC